MTQKQHTIHTNQLLLVIALTAEAKAIRSSGHWQRMDKVPNGMACYQRQDKPMCMIITGSGKVASAIGTAWLLEQHAREQVWPSIINIGLAGSEKAPLGALYWVNKVTEAATQKSYYPQHPAKHGLSVATLRTFDSVQMHYPEYSLVDMEASGFMQAACGWAGIERIAILKLISDNALQSAEAMSPKDVVDLIQLQRPMIEKVWDAMIECAEKLEVTRSVTLKMDAWHAQWHFTFTQKQDLKKHLHALALFMPGEESVFFEACKPCKQAKEVLASLQAIRTKTDGQLFHG